MATKSIAIIIGSTRKPRVGPHVAEYVKETLTKKAESSGLSLALVDVDEFKLPVFDESVLPGQITSAGSFVHEHSRAWSTAVAKHDAYIFISPEYNYSVPGGVKNAIDYLNHEWKGKPLGVVTYGLFGATHASEQLQHILSKMGVRVAETRPQLGFAGGVGPDAMAAMGGNLGQDTKSKWDAEDAGKLVKVLDELKELLDTKPEPAK